MVQLRRRDLATGRVESFSPTERIAGRGGHARGGAARVHDAHRPGNAETRLVSLSGDQRLRRYPNRRHSTRRGRFSPDGRFICFAWGIRAATKLYVAPSASPGERIRISSGGAIHGFALWSRDGSEIFYLSPQGK